MVFENSYHESFKCFSVPVFGYVIFFTGMCNNYSDRSLPASPSFVQPLPASPSLAQPLPTSLSLAQPFPASFSLPSLSQPLPASPSLAQPLPAWPCISQPPPASPSLSQPHPASPSLSQLLPASSSLVQSHLAFPNLAQPAPASPSLPKSRPAFLASACYYPPGIYMKGRQIFECDLSSGCCIFPSFLQARFSLTATLPLCPQAQVTLLQAQLSPKHTLTQPATDIHANSEPEILWCNGCQRPHYYVLVAASRRPPPSLVDTRVLVS
ncbi:proline-rich protein 36-like [Scylla paramamosain]|uniref:proline-rich protein 36-like n=1 Tax=Scylla paramamosain TaxID=85552 RepID=UPI0030839312